VRQLNYYYMEDDGGGLMISGVDPQLKAAVTKVTFLLIVYSFSSFAAFNFSIDVEHKQTDLSASDSL